MDTVLVDTSVWVAHFRGRVSGLEPLLHEDLASTHSLVIGELACGTPPQRQDTFRGLVRLRWLAPAAFPEVLQLIEEQRLFGQGCGWVGLSLLASVIKSPNATLWTLDKNLRALADRFSVSFSPRVH